MNDFELNVTADVEKVQRMLHNIRNHDVARAASRALNRTASQVRTAAVKDLKADIGHATGLGSAAIRKNIRITKAKPGKLIAVLTPSGHAIPLINFSARQVAAGVSHKAWDRRQIATHAFIATMPSGHRGVFTRKGKKRLPIRELYGPSLPKEFSHRKILEALRRRAIVAWPKNFQNELNYYLSMRK